MQIANDVLVVGSRVHCILHGGENGVIVAIHGEQSPESCRSLGGIISTGGEALFDVVWDNGRKSVRLPEALIHSGVQWRVLPEVWTAEQVADALARAAIKEAADEARAVAESNIFAAAVADLRVRYPKLVEGDSAKVAAGNIRTLLKERWPKVKFSVRSDYSSIRVRWEDGPLPDQVTAITNPFKAGNFNGMTDSYESQSNPWHIFGSAEYLFTDRDVSDQTLQTVLDYVTGCRALQGNLRDVPKPSVEDMRSFARINVPGIDECLREIVTTLAHRHFDGTTGKFVYDPEGRYSRFAWIFRHED